MNQSNTPPNKDFLNGDHSFKMWFKIMWKNGFIFLFLVGFTLLVLQVLNFNTVLGWLADAYQQGIGPAIMVTAGMFIPLAMSASIAYKAFYQYWDDLKKGRSR